MGQSQSTVEYVGGITDAELLQHNTKDNLWIKIHDKIYDVTKFVDHHPGGVNPLMSVAGKDATVQFEKVGHSAEILKKATEKYCVGHHKEGKKTDKIFLNIISEKNKEIESLKAQLAAIQKQQ